MNLRRKGNDKICLLKHLWNVWAVDSFQPNVQNLYVCVLIYIPCPCAMSWQNWKLFGNNCVAGLWYVVFFLISAIVVPWAGMIWTDSGWSPIPSFIQLFTTPKVFCTICAALAGLLWWVFSSVFYKLLCVDWLLQLCEQLCFRAREILKVSCAVMLSSYRSVLNVLDFLLNLLTNNSKFQSLCTPVIWIRILESSLISLKYSDWAKYC